ncbi:hypothetical protein P175DRAFT_0440841 [Aspergillus ochraceoroseus IBT 24754]|uniref:Uncharacterized protein n=2 Tax=Aspergillus ochraceoroseus TaxID=138278 RepID=A0A2T5LSA9_9EURO|nr:uncharacterized protein P175DRAFT_0440841 [Aspergillus ochraceoroseus IBT 24754]PTU19165.1 hypothetical protein P175DRAFT_0440841 [Aspergillus ochraceoroseus IBT 24754]
MHNTPDLNSILRTLSTFSKQPQSPLAEDHDSYEPPEALLPSSSYASASASASTSRTHQGHAGPQKPTTTPNTHTNTTSTDPATITTWPPALKQVMRAVSQNEEMQRRIRFLIQRQHDHEKQWWAGREALVAKQRARAEKKKELDAVLLSVGAPIDTKQVSTAEEDRAEVKNYDAKVYKASTQMAHAMQTELRSLNVPFFCLRSDLIDPIADGAAAEAKTGGGGSFTLNPALSGRLPRDEVLGFQRRMLDLLQDLCKE